MTRRRIREEWRPVLGWERLYFVSDLGRVKTEDRICVVKSSRGNFYKRVSRGRILKPWISDGYPCVTLGGEGRKPISVAVHRLVLRAFVGPRSEGKESCHENGDRSDPRLVNLRWGTRRSNIDDIDFKHGTRVKGEEHPKARLDVRAVLLIRQMKADGASLTEIARELRVTHGTVWSVVNNLTWKHVK